VHAAGSVEARRVKHGAHGHNGEITQYILDLTADRRFNHAILAFSKIKANAAFPQQRPPAKWLFWLDAVEDCGAP
jgi:hypothetical protein